VIRTGRAPIAIATRLRLHLPSYRIESAAKAEQRCCDDRSGTRLSRQVRLVVSVIVLWGSAWPLSDQHRGGGLRGTFTPTLTDPSSGSSRLPCARLRPFPALTRFRRPSAAPSRMTAKNLEIIMVPFSSLPSVQPQPMQDAKSRERTIRYPVRNSTPRLVGNPTPGTVPSAFLDSGRE